jgi:phosphate transport system substrate-binding protein
MQIRAGFARTGAGSRGFDRMAGWFFSGVFVVGLALPVCVAQPSIILVGSGSTVPLPLYAKWVEQYNRRNPKVQMRYLPIGTSESIKEILHGSGDFAAGEVPLTAKQRADGGLVEVPSLLIGIVPIYNLPGLHGELRLSGAVLAEIFLGQVKTWSSPSIARLNPKLSLPDLPIKVVYRPAGKGSNYVFSDFLSKSSPQFRTEIGTSPSPEWPVGTPAERSSDMGDKVKSEPGSIGYVEAQYAIKMNIPHGSVLNPAGHFVKASEDTISAACLGVEEPGWNRLSASLTNAPGAESFPITSFTWLYLRTASHDPVRAAALSDLLNWIFSEGQRIASEDGYSELPLPLLEKVKTQISSLR